MAKDNSEINNGFNENHLAEIEVLTLKNDGEAIPVEVQAEADKEENSTENTGTVEETQATPEEDAATAA